MERWGGGGGVTKSLKFMNIPSLLCSDENNKVKFSSDENETKIAASVFSFTRAATGFKVWRNRRRRCDDKWQYKVKRQYTVKMTHCSVMSLLPSQFGGSSQASNALLSLTHTHKYMYTHKYTHKQTHVHTQTCTPTNMYTHKHTHTHFKDFSNPEQTQACLFAVVIHAVLFSGPRLRSLMYWSDSWPVLTCMRCTDQVFCFLFCRQTFVPMHIFHPDPTDLLSSGVGEQHCSCTVKTNPHLWQKVNSSPVSFKVFWVKLESGPCPCYGTVRGMLESVSTTPDLTPTTAMHCKTSLPSCHS